MNCLTNAHEQVVQFSEKQGPLMFCSYFEQREEMLLNPIFTEDGDERYGFLHRTILFKKAEYNFFFLRCPISFFSIISIYKY